ncbi:hypothetical protein HDU98_007879 [Podochytrium sp. JEL0797]|nr:hypothetical protein HDU98_007879 [Podochytrium sp. JEL0797]
MEMDPLLLSVPYGDVGGFDAVFPSLLDSTLALQCEALLAGPPKKKPGRKPKAAALEVKREPQPRLLVPKPLSPSDPGSVPSADPSFAPISTSAPITPPSTASSTSTSQKHHDRMIKNRAAADESRKKHKEHVENLDKMCRALLNENLQLRQRVKDLEAKVDLFHPSPVQSSLWNYAFDSSPIDSSPLSSSNSQSPLVLGNPMLDSSSAMVDDNLFNLFFASGDFVFGGAGDSASSASDSVLEMGVPLNQQSLSQQSARTPLNQNGKRTAGTVFMAVLFSISMLIFPSPLFQPATPSISSAAPYHPQTHKSEVLAPRSFLSTLTKYTPQTLLASPTTPNPHARPELEGVPPVPLIESQRWISMNGIVGQYIPPAPSAAKSSGGEYLEIHGRVPFLTIEARRADALDGFVVLGGDSRAPRQTNGESTSMCNMHEILAFLESKATRDPREDDARETSITHSTRLARSQPSSSATTTATAPLKLRISRDKLASLQSLLLNPNTTAISSSTAASTSSPMVIPARTTTTATSTDVSNQPEDDASLSGDAESLIPYSPLPIRTESDRASVMRRNLARSLSSKSDPFVISTESRDWKQGEYCRVEEGPLLSVVAELGEEEGGEEGWRLMLDVKVVGAKLVRHLKE